MSFGPFSEVLDLEQEFYENGFEQGLADGEAAGQSEGRTLGLEKGFEKFCESGRLYGRSIIWANQLSIRQNQKTQARIEEDDDEKVQEDEEEKDEKSANNLQKSSSSSPLFEFDSVFTTVPKMQKLFKNIKSLHALVETESLSFENTEEAVADFDDRVKRARTKFKLIKKLIDDSQSTEERKKPIKN